MKESEIQAIIWKRRAWIRKVVGAHVARSPGIDADDIEQEVMIRLLRALRSERKITHLSSYLRRVITAAIIDTVRKQQRTVPTQSLEPLAEEGSPQSAEPAAAAANEPPEEEARKDTLKMALECINALPTNRALAVKMHIQGFTTREIGEMAGWSEAKARNLASRGMISLRDMLAKQGIVYESE